MARILILIGLICLLLGIVLTWFPGALSWFGRLPGDIRIESANSRFYFPLSSMLITSIVLTLVVNLFNRL